MSLEKHHQSGWPRSTAKKLTISAGSASRSQSSGESNLSAHLATVLQLLGPDTSKKLMPEKSATEKEVLFIFADQEGQSNQACNSELQSFLNEYPIDETAVNNVSNPNFKLEKDWGNGNSFVTQDSKAAFSNDMAFNQMQLVNPGDVGGCHEIAITNEPEAVDQQLYYVEVQQPQSVSYGSVPEVGGNIYSDLFGTSMDESMGFPIDVSEEYFKVDPELEQLDVMDLVMNDDIGADDPRILRLVDIPNDEEMQADRPGTSPAWKPPILQICSSVRSFRRLLKTQF